jgi:fructose-1,6-bisphosphatase/inositol monophosphatase family enzyme
MTELPDDLRTRHPLLAIAWSAAHRAGAFLRDERPDDLRIDTKSTITDVVSEMDRGAERMLVDDLLGARPADGFLGEEGGERHGTSGVRWVVDPLDGTVNYLHRIPMWGVSVAAEVHGAAELGVVVLPEFGETYVGVLGGGAWLVREGQVQRLRVSECASLERAVVATGFGYRAERRVRQAEVVRALMPRVADIRRMGAAVVDFCWLARGRVDAYYESGLNPWDTAAGALIATEAGIVITGSAESADYFVAATPAIASELAALLLDLGADRV